MKSIILKDEFINHLDHHLEADDVGYCLNKADHFYGFIAKNVKAGQYEHCGNCNNDTLNH